MMNKTLPFILIFILSGCNAIYEYVFLPPKRVAYTLVPDKQAVTVLNDSSYFISKDGLSMGYDAKNWKVEIRYMTDYQLNTFEFPQESKSGVYSGNPFTYGNWIDPSLGYTPRRFSVFKVTIYNYTGSKLNFDPEISLLQTDRGDNLNAYAREQKNAKYLSMEDYFKKQKGSSGVEDEIYETRMGIARRTMLYYGKPIYKGDSREGLVVYDPIVDEVEKLKISIPRFVIGYDENNEPSDYIDLNFFFQQVPFEVESYKFQESAMISSDTTSQSNQKLSGSFRLAQLKYIDDARSSILIKEKLPQIKDIWDPNPKGITNLLDNIRANTKLNTSLSQVTSDELTQGEFDVLLITGVGASPMLDQNISSLVEFIEKGGLVIFDISTFKNGIVSSAYKYFQSISEQLKGNVQIKNMSTDHPIFNAPKKLPGIPSGYESINGNIEPASQMRGIFLNGKLVAVETSKSYSMIWGDNENTQALDFGINLAAYSVSNRKK